MCFELAQRAARLQHLGAALAARADGLEPMQGRGGAPIAFSMLPTLLAWPESEVGLMADELVALVDCPRPRSALVAKATHASQLRRQAGRARRLGRPMSSVLPRGRPEAFPNEVPRAPPAGQRLRTAPPRSMSCPGLSRQRVDRRVAQISGGAAWPTFEDKDSSGATACPDTRLRVRGTRTSAVRAALTHDEDVKKWGMPEAFAEAGFGLGERFPAADTSSPGPAAYSRDRYGSVSNALLGEPCSKHHRAPAHKCSRRRQNSKEAMVRQLSAVWDESGLTEARRPMPPNRPRGVSM